MTVNRHIQRAIEQHRNDGVDFHDVVSWHLLHGVAMFHPDFIVLGYYCRHDEPLKPRDIKESDCGYVTYLAGNMKAAMKVSGDGIEFIGFRRGYKNLRPSQVYPMNRVAALIQQQTHHDHGRRISAERAKN